LKQNELVGLLTLTIVLKRLRSSELNTT